MLVADLMIDDLFLIGWIRFGSLLSFMVGGCHLFNSKKQIRFCSLVFIFFRASFETTIALVQVWERSDI